MEYLKTHMLIWKSESIFLKWLFWQFYLLKKLLTVSTMCKCKILINSFYKWHSFKVVGGASSKTDRFLFCFCMTVRKGFPSLFHFFLLHFLVLVLSFVRWFLPSQHKSCRCCYWLPIIFQLAVMKYQCSVCIRKKEQVPAPIGQCRTLNSNH